MLTIEEQIKESERILAKLREDITELQAEKSNKQNKIKEALDAAKEKSDKEHAARMEKLEQDYRKKFSALEERTKYLDEYNFRINERAGALTPKERLNAEKEKVLETGKEEFIKQKEETIKKLQDIKKGIDKETEKINARKNSLDAREKEQKENNIILNGLQLSIDNQRQELEGRVAEINGLLEKNKQLLAENTEKLSFIEEESKNIKKNLEAMQQEKANLIKMSAWKDDLEKIEKERASLEAKQKELKKYSKQIEARDIAVKESEITNKEKERFLALLEREVNKKIAILRKLRQGQDA